MLFNENSEFSEDFFLKSFSHRAFGCLTVLTVQFLRFLPALLP